jgi:hypothetical protein
MLKQIMTFSSKNIVNVLTCPFEESEDYQLWGHDTHLIGNLLPAF